MGIDFDSKDLIDILLVAFLMYQTYRLLKGTNAVNIFMGIMAFIVCWFLVTFVLKMELLGAILDKVMSVGAIALIILFQSEIRRFFSLIGRKRNWSFFNFFSKTSGIKNEIEAYSVMQIVVACRNMSRNKCGALIVMEKNVDLSDFLQSGEQVNATINSRLIENLFFKNSPLHDGAMIISNKKIMAVGCILPVSQNQTISKRLGLRHRAALGITEKTDATAVIVSEETGRIAIAQNGELTVNVSEEQLERLLYKEQAVN
ncbi:MAG: diadenylate cyclase CdaA [Paludibacteraceae bacterium]|nr:diadenylate cyclase CdaA [Paludibacteraceae bacterium]MBN2787808.1 diadenylate cyclase CdaA [Paludibacteraceae bacterium]